MRTEIRNFIVDRLEQIDTIESPNGRRKAFGGVLVTLLDIIEDVKMDLGEAIALNEINKLRKERK